MLSVPDNAQGRVFRCPRCQTAIRVAASAVADAAPASTPPASAPAPAPAPQQRRSRVIEEEEFEGPIAMGGVTAPPQPNSDDTLVDASTPPKQAVSEPPAEAASEPPADAASEPPADVASEPADKADPYDDAELKVLKASSGPAEEKKSGFFSSSNSGIMLLFFTGITFGTLAMFTFHQYEMKIVAKESSEYRRTAELWRAAADRENAEAAYKIAVQKSLRVVGSTRRINEKTEQQMVGLGWTGITQTIVKSDGGKLWRVWTGGFINGSENRIEGIKVVITAETSGAGEFGQATLRAGGAAMGVCAGKNLFCAQPDQALSLDAVRGCEDLDQLKALITKTLSSPKVRTSVEAGKELPFMVVQEANHFQVIPDNLVSVTFKREPIERVIDRGTAGKQKRKRRRIKRRKKRPRR